jgi:hypothetical protein
MEMTGGYQEFMGQMVIEKEGVYGKSWLACMGCVAPDGALVETLM